MLASLVVLPHLVAPAATARSTASATRRRLTSIGVPRPPPTSRSRWTRFLAVLGSGTRWKNSRGPTPSGSTREAKSPHSSRGYVAGLGPRFPAVEPLGRVLLDVADAPPPEGGERWRVGRVEDDLERDGHGGPPRVVGGAADPPAGVRQPAQGRPSPARAAGSTASSAAAAARTQSTSRAAGTPRWTATWTPRPSSRAVSRQAAASGSAQVNSPAATPFADHRGQGLLPAQVELARHLGQLGAAQGLAPGVDPEQPRLRRPGGGVEAAGSGPAAGRRCRPRRRWPTAGPGPRRRRAGTPPRAGSPCW